MIGRWGDEEFLGIFGNVDRKKLKALDKFYCVILKKTDLSATGFTPVLETGAALADAGDEPESIIEKAKKTAKTIK